MSKYTDAPEIYHRACALTTMGSLLTRESHRAVLNAGVPPIWPNLWTVLVGDSAHDRKSTAIEMAQQIVKRIEVDILAPDDMTPEGLLDHFIRRESIPEEGPSGLLVQSEFIQLLLQFRRQYSALLKGMLLRFYDVPDVYRRKLRNKLFETHNPRVSMLGAIATEFLATYGQSDDWLGGLFNRCLFISGKKTREQKDLPQVSASVYDSLAMKLGKTLGRWKKTVEERFGEPDCTLVTPTLNLSKAANEVLRAMPTGDDDPHLNSVLGRTTRHWSKIAVIEQVDEDPESHEIGRGAAERALEMVGHWRENIPDIVAQCFSRGREDFEGDRLHRTILRYLRRSPGQTATFESLLRHCVMSVHSLRDVLEDLQHANMVTRHVPEMDDGEETVSIKA